MFWGKLTRQETREALKREATEKHPKTIIDHSEILIAIFCNHIQSENYGRKSSNLLRIQEGKTL